MQRQRIHDMAETLERELRKDRWGGFVKLEWFAAQMQFKYGLNPSTTRKYLKTLETLEKILVDDKAGTISEWYDREALKQETSPEKEV